jgi:hypothetical protein
MVNNERPLEKMIVTFTCHHCGSGVSVYPQTSATTIHCEICHTEKDVFFTQSHEEGLVQNCPGCQKQDFYKQKDFNRRVGVFLFILASILSIWTYGVSFIILYAVDFFLFKRLGTVVVCYACQTIFRHVKNLADIREFDHEMNDRIVYGHQEFSGRPLPK